ncbi:bile acid:sodium symporter family protein [Streptomyces sp. NBC_01244]|uniref:bile acid:sodium symporter family protein n=1 Tax=Streptomyces sp. NBC_01244 TaxID=2903797 RepID=UPI002E12023B|nr:bile acid:sodium symporter family protein [Streptomyces sp. NBC_01244]
MRDSLLGTLFLPLAVGVVMFGLGLSLVADDFARAVRRPRVVLITLVCQLVVVPLFGLGLIMLFRPEPAVAVGVMLLVATPGGTLANFYSHLCGADVALNLTLTAVTSVISVVSIPLIINASITHFLGDGQSLGMQPDKVVQVIAIVLVPVGLGMLARRAWPGFAVRMERPVKVLSMLTLATAVVSAMMSEWKHLAEAFVDVGVVVTLLLAGSLAVGYLAPRMFAVPERQAVAASLEIGLHNTPLAIAIALSPQLLDDPLMAVAPATYSLMALLIAGAFTYVMSRRLAKTGTPVSVSSGSA